MSEYGSLPTIDEIKLAVADVVDSYYSQLVNYLDNKFSNMQLGFDYISGLLGSISSNLTQHRQIEDVINTASNNVLAIKQDMDCIEGAIRDFDSHLPTYYDALANKISSSIWNNAPPEFKQAFKGWNKLLAKYFGIVEPDPPGIFEDIFNFFSGISDSISSIVDFFTNLWNELENFLSNPLSWMENHILQPIWDGLEWIGGKIYDGLTWLWNKAVDLGNWIGQNLQNAGKIIYNSLKNFGIWIYNNLENEIDWFIENVFGSPLKVISDNISKITKNILKDMITSQGDKGEVYALFAIPMEALPYFAGALAPGYILEEVPKIIEVEGEASGKILSVGVALKTLLKPSKILEWTGKTFRTITEKILDGFMLGIGFNMLDPYKYLMRPIAKAFATDLYKNLFGIDAFLELPSETQIEKFVRRSLPLKILQDLGAKINKTTATITDDSGNISILFTGPYLYDDVKKYVKTILQFYGLPDMYLNIFAIDENNFEIIFRDRFGQQRTLYLLPWYELPEHSELLRMVQRDIFPDIAIASGLASLRGWPADLTKSMYLMTFQYPPFEKLWNFYMRAVSGMLWFNPPNTIKQVFSKEAQALSAGTPLSPYELQSSIANKGKDALSGFETALNAYFKWIQYSNFSWFTENTTMYGINVGKDIINKLGGWTADSWLMADLAADIPQRIDLRWMSRFGIFQWLSNKFANMNIDFKNYTAWVDLIKNVTDDSPTGNISVSLKWFSKLLQATGLHPAWVPISTVSENIMTIADEMTLLRTGWLNLFKQGVLTLDKVDTALNGLITVSYEVGYWDSTSKEWTSKWINLPIRWLPHEIKLLELRMVMDRFDYLYKEYRNYLIRFASRNIITKDDIKTKLQDFITLAVYGKDSKGGFYIDGIKNITGLQNINDLAPYLPAFDQKFLDSWEPIIEDLYEEEKIERARTYMRYIVSRLIERYAQGFITDTERDQYIQIFQNYVKMTDVEISMIKDISSLMSSFYERQIKFEALINKYKRFRISLSDLQTNLKNIGISESLIDDIIDKYAKSYVPSLSQLATIAESVPEIFTETIDNVPYYLYLINFFDLNDTEKKIWRLYIERKPYINEVNSLLSKMKEFMVYGGSENIINNTIGTDYKSFLKDYGVDEKELQLIFLQILMNQYEKVWSEVHISASKYVSWFDYMPEIQDEFTNYLTKWSVPSEVINNWTTYMWRKKLSDDIKEVKSKLITLLKQGINITNIDFNSVFKAASNIWAKIGDFLSQYGYTEKEFQLWQLSAFLENKQIDIPSPSFLATIGDYVFIPDDLIDESLTFHKIKENWRQILKDYIKTKPLRSSINKLIDNLYNSWIKEIPLGEYGEKALGLIKQYGMSNEELSILQLSANIESIIKGYDENWPTPLTLASIAEVVPESRSIIDIVFDKKKVPPEIRGYLRKYVQLKPLQDEIKNLITEMIYDYGYGVLQDEHMYILLSFLEQLGLEQDEIKLIYTRAVLYRLRIQRKTLPTTEIQKIVNDLISALTNMNIKITTSTSTTSTTTSTTKTSTTSTKPTFIW